jgi:hypothetical protein
MEAITYIISIGAGAFYLLASYRLLKLSHQTRERPEFWLGTYFAATGQWYLIYNAPYFFGYEELPPLLDHGIEWIYAIGVAAYALFVRCTFRPRSGWALIVVIVAALCSLAGATASSLEGAFSNAIDDPAYRIEWIGYTIPCVWTCVEGFIAHGAAQRRVRLELCDPIVANRYLLFGSFGLCQIISCLADLFWAYTNTTDASGAWLASGLLSAIEIASVAVLWLAFFPPRAYRRWIDARTALRSAEAEGA